MSVLSQSESKFLEKIIKNPEENVEKVVSLIKNKIQAFTSELESSEKKLKESERTYHGFVNNISDLIYEIDIKGKCSYVSHQLFDISGFFPEEMIGQNVIKFVHPDDLFMVAEEVKIAFDSEDNRYIEFRMRHKDGHYVHVSSRFHMIYIREKQKLTGVLVDITESKQVEQKLKESEKKYRSLFENSPIALMNQDFSEMKKYIDNLKASGINDLEKYFDDKPDELLKIIFKPIIVGVNKKAIEVYKAKSKEDFFSSVNQLSENVDHTLTEEAFLYNKLQILSLINGKTTYDSEIETQTFQGDPIHLYIKTSIASGFESTWSNIIVSIIDITERKEAEQKLKESEEKYKSLFERSPMAILLINYNGKIEDCNNATEVLFGYTKEELLGIDYLKFGNIPLDTKLILAKSFSNFLKTGAPEHSEIQMHRKDGKMIWINSYPISVQIAEISYILVVIQNVTDRVLAEQELIESEKKYRVLFENTPIGVTISDYRGNVIDINEHMKKLFGYELKELQKLGVATAYSDDQDRIPFKNQLEDQGYIQDYEVDLKKKDGNVFPALLNSIKTTISGEPIYINTIRDISEKKEMEEIKTHLLKRFSHEFKTPLISIKGFSDLLLSEYKNKLDEKTIGFLERIKEGANRLNVLINAFMQSSQLGEKLTNLNTDRANLSYLIKLGVSEMEGLINLRRHTINLDIPEELIGEFDKEKIYTVITNLLMNAINYTPPEGKIFIHSKIEGGDIFFSIKDSGIGLMKEDKRHLFKSFGKIEKYGKGWDIVSEGMGIGLYLSKEIISLHGGKIWAESEGKNKGSTFFFSLPRT